MGQSVLRDRKTPFRNGELLDKDLVNFPVIYRKGIRLIFLNRDTEIGSPRGSPVR
jgi:hypothetical protein